MTTNANGSEPTDSPGGSFEFKYRKAQLKARNVTVGVQYAALGTLAVTVLGGLALKTNPGMLQRPAKEAPEYGEA